MVQKDMKLNIYRRITQIGFLIFVGLIPALDILRFDSATHELIILGQVWGLGLKEGFSADQSVGGSLHIAVQFFLKAVLPWVAILAIFPVLGLIFGRFFCGWLCPEGALFEYADFLGVELLGRRSLYTKKANDPDGSGRNRLFYVMLAFASIVVIPVIGGMALTGFFINPRTIWSQIVNWEFTFGVKAGIIGVSIYMLTTSIFVRHAFCRYVCAAGLMQMLFGWVSPVSLRLNMDAARAQECTNCRKCEKACFMNVNPRKNRRDISCVNCGACIDACNDELGTGRGLFHYRMGSVCAGPEENCRTSDSCTHRRGSGLGSRA